MAAEGLVPADAARDASREGGLRYRGAIEESRQHQHDVSRHAAVRKRSVPRRRCCFGLTSSYVGRYAQAIQMRDACRLIKDMRDSWKSCARAPTNIAGRR